MVYSFIIRSLIFLSTIHLGTTLNFSISSFSSNIQNDNITLERDASAASQAIFLTRSINGESTNESIGRATYNQPMLLWDKASRNLTDFTTHFTFVINSRGRKSYGDGIAFFLAPNGSKAPENATKGEGLGLIADDQPFDKPGNKFVAVEFDIFSNTWDPQNSNIEHVGVDINSLKSEVTVSWLNSSSSIVNGWPNEAWISYVSSSKNLSLIFRTIGTNTKNQSLHFVVDLRDYLPEWVTFGFSAATGSQVAIHRITSWQFYSSLESNIDVTDPGVEGSSPSTTKTNKTGLVVGLAVGGSVILCSSALGIYIILRKKKREETEDDILFEDDSMDGEFEKGTGPKRFSYHSLAQATNNFSQKGEYQEILVKE